MEMFPDLKTRRYQHKIKSVTKVKVYCLCRMPSLSKVARSIVQGAMNGTTQTFVWTSIQNTLKKEENGFVVFAYS